MEEKINVSVAIATYNEETNLDRCLSSVVSWAGEIVVVDGGSTDRTPGIAKKYNAKVINTENPPVFHINKQMALDACRFKWILQLDADEVVPPQLAGEIQKIIKMTDKEIDKRAIDPVKLKLFKRHQKLIEQRDGRPGAGAGSYAAFFVPRRNYFLGHPLTYSGTYPDGVIRLVQKGKARFPVKSVHEQIVIDGKVGWLYNDLFHYSNPTFSRYLTGADKYTDLLADEIKSSDKNGFVKFFNYLFIKPTAVFLNLFIRHKGILDGWYGFLFDLFSAWHFPVAYFKYTGLLVR